MEESTPPPSQPQTMSYVAGFMFSPDLKHVALIRKNKPKWQYGLLNGIGGKIEPNEVPLQAVVREFSEETGVLTNPDQWRHFCTIKDHTSSFVVHFFACRDDCVSDVRSLTDEPVMVRETANVNPFRDDMIENLPWLIPLAIDHLTDGRPQTALVYYPA